MPEDFASSRISVVWTIMFQSHACLLMFEQNWSRLVCFIAAEDGVEHIDEPLDNSLDGKSILLRSRLLPQVAVRAAIVAGFTVSVRHSTGSSLLSSDVRATSTTLHISKLLSPLTMSEIGTLQCVNRSELPSTCKRNELGTI